MNKMAPFRRKVCGRYQAFSEHFGRGLVMMHASPRRLTLVGEHESRARLLQVSSLMPNHDTAVPQTGCHLELNNLAVAAAGVDPKQLELLAVEEQV